MAVKIITYTKKTTAAKVWHSQGSSNPYGIQLEYLGVAANFFRIIERQLFLFLC